MLSTADELDPKREVALAHLGSIPFSTPACPAERGFDECLCTDVCPLHGECRLCAAFHLQQGRLPFCQRPASTR
jgi:hypothetical protein